MKGIVDNLFEMEHGSVVDSSLGAQLIQRFVANTTSDISCEKIKVSISRERSFVEIGFRIKSVLTNGRMVQATLNRGFCYILGDVGEFPILISIYARNAREDYEDDEDEGAIDLIIDMYAEPNTAKNIKKKLDGMFENEKMAKIKWWYSNEGRTASRDIYLPKPSTVLHHEFYPDIGDPYRFIDDYLNSNAAVLLMSGPPGTGKTTLLRHMIVDRKLTAHVIYDEKLMDKDTIFQDFLFDKNSDIMIIEDADTILSPREDDGNKMMSRFLSVADGLIKLPNKKLVFTTNITDFNKVDQALTRPGRCFATVHTRPLNLTEAQAACKVANLPVPTEKGEYTLAELFNQGYRPKVRRVGFIG